MALDPNDPLAPWSWVPDTWTAADDVAPAPPVIGDVGAMPAPPPPQQVAAPAAPTQEEVPAAAWPPPEWAPPEVDAISGATPRQVGPLVEVSTEQPSPEAPSLDELAAPSDAALPSVREREDDAAGELLGIEMAQRSPEEQALFMAKVERARDNFAATRALEESERTRQALEDNLRVRDEAIRTARARAAEIDAEAKQIANTDPMSTIPGYRKLFGVLAAFIGGFAVNRTGRNVGLEMVESIANDAAQQQAQKLKLLARQRAGVGDDIAGAEDAFRAGEAARIATYDAAIRGLQSEVQLYDPRGTTAQRILGALSDLQARRADALAKYEQQTFDRQMKAGELALKARKQGLDETKFLTEQQRRAAAAAAGAAKPTKLEDLPLTADQLRAMGIAIPEDVQIPPMTIGQAKKLAETAKSAQDWQKAVRENSPEERARQFGVGELVDESGKPLQFRTTESAEKVATLKASADFAVQLLDRLITAHKRYGWTSDLVKSPEWQEAQADWNQYMLEKKNVDQLGVLAGPDLDLIKGTMGKIDPTGVRDPSAGLNRARANIVEKLNSTVRAQVAPGTKPKRWDPPKPPPPPPASPLQSTVQRLLTFDPERPRTEETRELGGIGKVVAGTAPAIPPSYARAIDQLVAVFNDPSKSDKEREEAGAHLDALKSQAASAAIREYATRAASAGAFESIPLSKD